MSLLSNSIVIFSASAIGIAASLYVINCEMKSEQRVMFGPILLVANVFNALDFLCKLVLIG